MADDNKAQIVVDGDVSPLKQKLREASEALKRTGEDGAAAFGRMTGPLEALQSKFLAVGAVLAGGAVFKAAVEESVKLTGEANALSKSLGISTDEAGALNIALGDIYSSADDFIGASQQLGRQLRTNESALNAMGLKTRESNGEYRNMKDLMMDSIKVLAGYKEGTDRNLAAQTLFGKGAGEVGKFLKLNNEVIEEARKKQEALGLTIGVENVEAAKAYKASMNDVGDVMSAFKKAIGDAVMPVLTKLGDWFSSIGPAAVVVIKGTIGGLVSLFWGLKFAGEAVWNGIAFVVETATVKILRFADTVGHALSLDFDGARDAWNRGTEQLEDIADKRLKNVMDSAEETREKLWNLFADPTAKTSTPQGGRGYVEPPDKAKKAKTEADPSYMQYYEAALGERKRLASEENALREYSKAEELAYWQTLLQYADLSTKDQLAIEKKVSDLIVAVRREEAKEKQALDTENATHAEAMALLRVDAEAAAAEDSLAAGQINAQARAELEIQFEQRRLEIQRAALQERLALAEQDPNTSPAERARLQHAIEKLEMQHGIKLVGLQRKVAQEQGRIWDDLTSRMSGLWDKGVQAIMNGTFRWRNAFKAIGSELVGWFAQSVVGNFVKEWLLGKAKQLAITMGFLSAEKTAQVAGSQATIATKTTEATTVAGANAVEAGTGAAGAMASIPFIGPVLALAAMASVFAAVSSMGSKVKSASRGFDIPRGLNPMTQLHEEEMVLPSQYANVIRGMASGDGGGQSRVGGDQHHYHINAIDARSFERFARDNKRALAGALKDAARDGYK
jgi:hypothetical protein